MTVALAAAAVMLTVAGVVDDRDGLLICALACASLAAGMAL